MKTNELIKLLQEEDPSGELHVRLDGGFPSHVERKPGYYDGEYMYIENEKLIITTKGEKIDIQSSNEEDFIWDSGGDISQIEIDVYASKIDSIKNRIEKISKEAKYSKKESIKIFTFEVLEELKKGFNVIESDEDCKFLYYYKNDIANKISMNFGSIEAIRKSGFFVRKTHKHNDSNWTTWELII